MPTIGILPASGRASRIAGIPKFCIPLSDTKTLLHWHVERMLEVCDEVRVCTQSMWVPFIESLQLPITLYVKGPSTMSDAVAHLIGSGHEELYLVGMPDTVFLRTTGNPYKALRDTHGDVVLAAFACREDLQGHVGQVRLEQQQHSWQVLEAVDKQAGCTFGHMWGAMRLRGGPAREINRSYVHPGVQLPEWIARYRQFVRATVCDGEYIDVGRVEGLSLLYNHLASLND